MQLELISRNENETTPSRTAHNYSGPDPSGKTIPSEYFSARIIRNWEEGGEGASVEMGKMLVRETARRTR